MKEEICEECIGIIGLADQAYVYEGRIVCEQCDKKLRQGDRQAPISPDAEDTWKAQQVQESPGAEDTWKAQQPPESSDAEDTWKAQASEELFDSVEAQEHKETLEVQEPQESKELPAAEDTWKTQESEEIFELLQRQESEELGELQEPEETIESREREEPLEFQEAEEASELQEPVETEEPITCPVEEEETAEVAEVDSAKPLTHRQKRISSKESKLLTILLVAWSCLCFFMLFYVPERYAEVLSDSAFDDKLQLGGFADDCLIIFFMVLWFFGALGLYVAIIGSEKDEKIDEKLRILKLLGF